MPSVNLTFGYLSVAFRVDAPFEFPCAWSTPTKCLPLCICDGLLAHLWGEVIEHAGDSVLHLSSWECRHRYRHRSAKKCHRTRSHRSAKRRSPWWQVRVKLPRLHFSGWYDNKGSSFSNHSNGLLCAVAPNLTESIPHDDGYELSYVRRLKAHWRNWTTVRSLAVMSDCYTWSGAASLSPDISREALGTQTGYSLYKCPTRPLQIRRPSPVLRLLELPSRALLSLR